MKKLIFLLLTVLVPFVNGYSQEEEEEPFDGFGAEGNGDAQTNAPNAPIDGILIPLFISGLLLSIYVLRKKEKQLN